MEWWSKGVMGFGMGEDAGPEAGAPTEAKWKMDCLRGLIGRLGAKMVVLNYTYLHAFTRFYTKFLTGVHRRGAETQRGAELGTKLRNGVLESWSIGMSAAVSGAHGVYALRRGFGLNMAGQADDEADDDGEAAPELAPVQGFMEPDGGEGDTRDGLRENGQGGDVDVGFPNDNKPEGVTERGANDGEVTDQPPATQRQGERGFESVRAVDEQIAHGAEDQNEREDFHHAGALDQGFAHDGIAGFTNERGDEDETGEHAAPLDIAPQKAIEHHHAKHAESKAHPTARADMFAQKNGRRHGRQQRFDRHEHGGVAGGAELVAIDLEAMAQREDHQTHEHRFQQVTTARRPARQPLPKGGQRQGCQAEAQRDNAARRQVIL